MRAPTRAALTTVTWAVLALGASGCGEETSPSTAEDPASSASPAGPRIGGVYVGGPTEGRRLVQGTELRVTLDGGTLGLSAGCNTFSGEATWDDGVLRATNLGGTEMGCADDLAAQDSWLVEFFGSAPRIAVDGDDVSLTSGSTVVWLVPFEDPGPPAPLEGTTWSLTSIATYDGDSGSVGSYPDLPTTTLTLADGRLTLALPCNTGSGTYRLAGDRLLVRGLGVSRMACRGAGGEVERQVLQVLEADPTVTIRGPALSLSAGRPELQLRSGS